MKRSWLIGAALLFSLSAVACSDDDDTISSDASVKHDGGGSAIVDGGLDGSVGIDSGINDAGESDGGDSGL